MQERQGLRGVPQVVSIRRLIEHLRSPSQGLLLVYGTSEIDGGLLSEALMAPKPSHRAPPFCCRRQLPLRGALPPSFSRTTLCIILVGVRIFGFGSTLRKDKTTILWVVTYIGPFPNCLRCVVVL